MKNIQPMPGKLLIEPCEIKQAKGSLIIIPDSVKEKPVEGIVVAVGQPLMQNGNLRPVICKVGQRVLFSKYGGTELKLDSHDYRLTDENDVLAILS